MIVKTGGGRNKESRLKISGSFPIWEFADCGLESFDEGCPWLWNIRDAADEKSPLCEYDHADVFKWGNFRGNRAIACDAVNIQVHFCGYFRQRYPLFALLRGQIGPSFPQAIDFMHFSASSLLFRRFSTTVDRTFHVLLTSADLLTLRQSQDFRLSSARRSSARICK